MNLSGDSSAIVTSADAAEVGNLIADDEWLGLTMELAILVRRAPASTQSIGRVRLLAEP